MNQSPSGGALRGYKDFDGLSHSHDVCCEFVVVVRNGLNLSGKNGSPHPLSGFKCGYGNGWEPSQHVFQHDIHFSSVKDLCL